uniref:alpha-1,2-Mannosidase n=1 Tax=Elaeophora elaphi TaxID=1147741 RepID=A0A0R3RFS0_9BILA
MVVRYWRKSALIGVIVFLSFLFSLYYLPSSDDSFLRSGRLFRSDRSRFLAQVRQHEFELGKLQFAKERKEVEDQSDTISDERRQFIINMTKFAWENYRKYAWGFNELKPISRCEHSASVFGSGKLGATIVDALDTLYIMGLKEEYEEGRDWVANFFDLKVSTADISVFETNIRFVGGLLAAYALTGDKMYIQKAAHVANILLPAFETPTGIPHALVNPVSGHSHNWGWANGGFSVLSEFGSLQLELGYLSQLTRNSIYSKKVARIREVVLSVRTEDGLYPNYLHPKSGKWGPRHVSVGALGDSFYEYLLKSWLRSGKNDAVYKEMYDAALAAIKKYLLRYSRQNHLAYFIELKGKREVHKMDHLACFVVGLLALEALNENDVKKRNDTLKLAEEIANTCHESYIRTATGIGPESFRFTNEVEVMAMRDSEKYYILRPEVIEGWFYLWRATRNNKYREWCWMAAKNIEKHCRTAGGYSGIKNVYSSEVVHDDVQQSFLFAETFKYLYLTFSNDSVMPLNKWVFNTEAHAFPVVTQTEL